MNAHPFLFEDSFQASCELPILPAPASLDGSGEEPLPKRLSWVKSVQEGAVGFRRT